MKPISCRLHEYTGTLTHNVSRLGDRVDYYFYYDLMRMTLPTMFDTINGDGKALPKVDVELCDRFKDSTTSTMNATLVVPEMTKSQNVSGKIRDDNGLSVAVPNIHKVLFDPSLDYHGKYGEFVIYSRDGGSENDVIDQVSESNYQDIGMRIFRVIYIKDRRLVKRHATWFYGEPDGLIISREYQEEDEGSKPAGEVAKGESDEAATSGEKVDEEKKEETPPAEADASGGDAAAAPDAAEGGGDAAPAPEAAEGGGDAAEAGGGEEAAPAAEEEKPVKKSLGSQYVACEGGDAADESGGEETEEGEEGDKKAKPKKKNILKFLVDYVRM